MEKLIEEQGCPQAFIASSLPVLEGAVRAIRDRLGAVPPEINIGTFDEHPMLGFLANNVWSMQQDENAWAEKAFEMMLSAIEDRPVKKTVKVEMKLIKRIRKNNNRQKIIRLLNNDIQWPPLTINNPRLHLRCCFTQQGELELYLENRDGKNTFIP